MSNNGGSNSSSSLSEPLAQRVPTDWFSDEGDGGNEEEPVAGPGVASLSFEEETDRIKALFCWVCGDPLSGSKEIENLTCASGHCFVYCSRHEKVRECLFVSLFFFLVLLFSHASLVYATNQAGTEWILCLCLFD